MKDLHGNNQKTFPDWMLGTDSRDAIKYSGKIGTGFLRKTLTEISKIFQNELMCERYAQKKGLMQSLDPRVRLVSILLFMVFTGITTNMLTLVFLATLGIMLAKLSHLSLLNFIKRVWFILPVIILIMSIPAATNPLIPGKVLFTIYTGLDIKGLPNEIYFSSEGVKAVLRMATRTGVSFSFGYVLVMTTRWTQLTKALGVLRVPKLIITILDMTYRYIFVLSKISIEIFEARFLRTMGKINNRENREFVSGSIAHMFLKSNYISEEIYNSMLCRGYTGEPVSLNEFKLSSRDYL